MMPAELPVPVQDFPHWRIIIRPQDYSRELIPDVEQCFQIINKCKTRFREREFPMLSDREDKCCTGQNWIASWSHYGNYIGYWRFYQSGQFLYLLGLREVVSTGWQHSLQEASKTHFSHLTKQNWDTIPDPGFVDVDNILWTVTEIFDFTSRLSQTVPYVGDVSIHMELKKVMGFIISHPNVRIVWPHLYRSDLDKIEFEKKIKVDQLIANSADQALEMARNFYKRFGWASPGREVLKNVQRQFMS